MRRVAVWVVLVAGVLAVGLAQQTAKKQLELKDLTKNAKSPPMEASVTINGKQLYILYHAPSVRGRKIFGGADALQPDNTIWRAGANEATYLHTDATLDVGGISVPAGNYTLYVALDTGQWSLIVSKQTGQWGIKGEGSEEVTTLDESQALGRAKMTMSKPPSLIEEYKITLSDEGGNKGKLESAWANVVASVPFTVK